VLIKGEGHPAGGIWYRLWNCGNVVVLDNFGRAKWDALTIYREQRGAAISQAVAEHGEGRHWGEWTARPLGSARTFMVSYEPHTGNPAAAAMYGGSGTKLYGVMVTANA
jgi:hypothetical protein